MVNSIFTIDLMLLNPYFHGVRLIAVMPVVGNLFGGERIYSSEGVLRLLLGDMIGETEPIPPLTTLVPATRSS